LKIQKGSGTLVQGLLIGLYSKIQVNTSMRVLSDTLYRRKIFESIKMKLVLSNLKKDLLVVLWGNKYAKSNDLEDSCRYECYDFEESFRVIGRKNNKHKGCSFEVPLT